MINLDDEIAQRINNSYIPDGKVCFLATASKDGEPDMGPKGSMMVFDSEHLAYWERSRRLAMKNVGENPNVAVVYFNPDEGLQWRFHGVATIYHDGEMREKVMARTIPQELERDPDRKGVGVVIRVDKMMTLRGEVLQER